MTDPITGTISYTYVITGERNTMTLPGGGTWTYHYDIYSGSGPSFPAGFILPKDGLDNLTLRLLSITDDQGRKVEYNEDWSGHLEYIKSDEVFDTGGSLVGYSETDPTYDTSSDGHTHYWLANLTTTWHGQDASHNPVSHMLRSDNYTEQGTDVTTGYDPNGQRLSDVITDNSGNLRTERYAYDKLNRLSTVNYGDGQTQSYSFDPMGNRLQKTDSSTGTTGYGYDAANRLLSTTGTGASTYANDADGNTLTGGGRTNAWDSQNRLVSCAYGSSTTANTYGADGLRRSSTLNGVTTYYAYDGQTLILEMHRNVTTGALYNTATYLQGMRGPEYRRDDTQTELDSQGRTVSKCRWYVYDGLGSVVGEVDVNGSLTSSPKYDVYGLVRANPGTASSAMGFVGGLGHLSEAGTGLIYMKARYYDPALGRFASEDPGASGENWFIYCNDNPVNFVDATGTTPGEEELFTELLEKVLSAFDYMSGIKAQEWIAEKVGGGFDKFYTRIFGESPFEQITKADPNAADAGTDELMVEYEVESKVQVDNVQSAGKVGTEVVIKADEEDAL